MRIAPRITLSLLLVGAVFMRLAPLHGVEKADTDPLQKLLKQGADLRKKRQLAKAAEEYEKALKLAEEIHGSEDLKLVPALQPLASVYTEMKQPVKALALYRRLAGIQEAELGSDSIELANSLYDWGELYLSLSQ